MVWHTLLINPISGVIRKFIGYGPRCLGYQIRNVKCYQPRFAVDFSRDIKFYTRLLTYIRRGNPEFDFHLTGPGFLYRLNREGLMGQNVARRTYHEEEIQ